MKSVEFSLPIFDGSVDLRRQECAFLMTYAQFFVSSVHIARTMDSTRPSETLSDQWEEQDAIFKFKFDFFFRGLR